MAGFTAPLKVEVEIVPPEGVVAERYAAWTTAAKLLADAFRSFLPTDALSLAAFLAAVDREDREHEPEEEDEVDLGDLETELAPERELDEDDFAEPEVTQ